MSCRIVHISDTHLGYSDLDRVGPDGVNVREADVYRSFSTAIDRILDIRPDVVVHSGDFFHRPSPANRPMVEGLSQLKRLSGAGIPLVIIAGNHSTPRTIYTSPILEALRSLDNVYPVFEQRYEKVELDGVLFHGLPHVNDEEAYSREINSIEPVKGRINILLLHTSIGKNFLMEEYGERMFPGEKISMLKDFHYTAAGHWHNFQEIAGLENAFYSGSTERFSDREAGKGKGFIIAKLGDDQLESIEFVSLPVRPWYRFDVKNCKNKMVEEIQKEIRECSSRVEGDAPLVSVYLNGISPAQSVDLPNTWLFEQFPGALAVIPNRKFFRTGSGLSESDMGSESLDDLFKSFLEENTENDKEYRRYMKMARDYFSRYETGE